MPLYLYNGSLLVRGGQLAIAEACCCLAVCCDNLPDTTYAVFEDLSGCTGRDGAVVPLTKITDMSGTYWWGETDDECEPKLSLRFECREDQTPEHHNYGLFFDSEPPYALPGCSRVPTPLNPSGAASQFPDDNQDLTCLPIYWSFEQCEDLWEDSCCDEGGSFRITWQTTAPP